MSIAGGLFALSAMCAVTSITKGYAMSKESEANADLIGSRTKLTDIRAGIEAGQYARMGGKVASQAQASIAASDQGMQGSALAVMIETQKQINLDMAVGQFNYEMEKGYNQAEADAVRRKGRYAIAAGYGNAFSTMLEGGYAFASQSKIFQKKEK